MSTENTASTSAETEQNTEAATSDAATETATPTQATDITQTPEFKAALTAAMEKKIPQLKRQIGKELAGEKEDGVTVESLQTQLTATEAKVRSYESRESVEAFLADGRNKLNVKPENVRGIQAIVVPLLEYGEDGKPANLKEAIESAKIIAPALFVNQPASINAANNGSTVTSTNMNDFIRGSLGYRGN